MYFSAWKSGKKQTIDYPMRPITRTKETNPIPLDLIYGVDTESLKNSFKKLETVAIPYNHGTQEEILTYEYLRSYRDPFVAFLDVVFDRHAEPEKGKYQPSWTKMQGEHGKRRRGRHKLPFILTVWYNLEYDIARLFHEESHFWRAVRTGHDGVKMELDGYELEIRHHLLFGSAPHFDYIFRRDGRILEMKAIDLWGYWKGGLDATAKALGLEGKIEIEEEFFDRELETLSPVEWDKLYYYAKKDPAITRQIYIKTAELLSSISQSVFSKGILPPSAPKASARICFSRLQKDELKAPPVNCIQHALNGYHGGYVYALWHGFAEQISVIDRKSAYPTILKMLPNPETVTYHTIQKGTHFESLIGKYGFVVASFHEANDKHPCVSLHGNDGRTMHPWGDFDHITISIPELAVGVLTGSVNNVVVHGGFYLKGEEGGIFYDFINRVYDLKNNSESKSPMYMVAKLLMNSLYGKLIEIHDLETSLIHDSDYDLIVPNIKDDAIKKELLTAYTEENYKRFEEICEENKGKDLTTFGKYLEAEVCTVGNYFTPVYASLVTALQRAWVVLVSRELEGLSGDTDSVFTPIDPDSPLFHTRIIKADIMARQIRIGVVAEGDNLGDYEVELKNGNGWIAGIKQYFLNNPNGKKPKYAHHAIIKPDVSKDDLSELSKEERAKIIKARIEAFYKNAIQNLSEGNNVEYYSASSPVKLKTSLMRGKDFGVFEKQFRTITAKRDNRLKSDGLFSLTWKNVFEIQDLLEMEED
jgi:hypothetical protein